MTTAQILGITDVSRRARWQRMRRAILPVIAGLVAIGAFLTLGPIGLGNGPLPVLSGGGVMTAAGPGPVAIAFLMGNSSRDRPVIDAVELIGGTKYASPRELSLDVETAPLCPSVGPARLEGHGFVLHPGCGRRDRGPLIGRSIGAHLQGFLGAAEQVDAAMNAADD